MRALVVYASAYGSTKGIAERIAETLRAEQYEVELASVDEPILIEKDHYDAFVIGSAIHAGRWLKSGIEFVRRNRDVLQAAPVWLFSSGPVGDKAVDEPQPEPKGIDEMRDVLDVRDHMVFGGAFDPETADLERANWIEKQFATHFIPAGDWRNWEDIEAWAMRIAANVKLEKEPVGIA